MGMILLAVVTTSVYCIRLIQDNDGAPGPEYVPINKNSYFLMLGFAFFMFEGIGCLMPIMKEVKEPEEFGKMTVAALTTLCVVYILFSSLCYYAWGSDLNQTVVTEMLPPANTFIQIMKLAYCINLVFSYPLTSVPANQTLQEYCFGTSNSGRLDRPDEKRLFWKVNAVRSLILASALLITTFAADSLDKVMGLAGSIFGMTNVLLIPSLCHLKLMA